MTSSFASMLGGFLVFQTLDAQFESVSGYGQEAAQLQKAKQGIPAINIGIPTRYGHSQSGVIDRADYDHTVNLVVRMVESLTAAELEKIRSF